ncbi:Translocase of chloroplast 34, partial [Cucurbita argyrosperma subsp. argyrosperma]
FPSHSLSDTTDGGTPSPSQSPPARLRLQLLVDRGAHSFMASQVIREWIGINNFAMATQVKLLELLGRLKLENVSTLTILVMGKGGVGKSSTVNSIIGERAVSVSPFQSEVPRPVMVSRSRAGFTLNIIDTPGIIEGGCINDQTLEIIKRFLLNKTIDILLYVDRLDAYRVDNLEKQVIKAITNSFGKAIWNRALVVLTHAQFSPPDGVPYEEFFSRRSEALLKTVRFGASFNKKDIQALNIPVVLVENSGRCNKNEKDEKVLPNGIAWIPHLVETITAVVLKEGTKSIFVDKNLIAGPNPNQRGKLLIPFIVVLQYLFAVRPIERAIRSDILNESRPSWETHEY